MGDEDQDAANEIAALKAEVKRWKGEAERAQVLAARTAEDSGSAVESKAKELAKKNRDLHLRVQRLQDEVNHARATAPGHYDPSTMTYSMRREKAKADEEAAAESQKYKGLYDAGVSRIGKLQQEVERLKMEKDKSAKALKTSQSKVASLEDQLESFRAHSKSPEREADGTRKRRGAGAADEDRLGLAWRCRHAEVVAELEQVKEELAEVRIVAEGALARRSVLEAQIKRTREQVRALVEKSEQDDALVTTLHSKLASGAAGSGDGQMLQELDTLRRRCAQQEAQLSTQEQIILSLNDHAGGGGGSAGGAADAGRKPSTPQQAQPVEEQRAASSAGTDQDVEAGGAEAGAASDEADDDVGT